jgi:Predicted pPIWI-associating nuclease
VTFPPARRKVPPADVDDTSQPSHPKKDLAFEVLLSNLDPDLLSLLGGARGALTSSNPDRVRHFSSSLRELFTQVLHRLAPDKAVQSWTLNPDHYDDKGRPTRRARLLYICRDINHGEFSAFLEAEILAILKFLNLFQGGTHKVRSDLSEPQLRAMYNWMEGHLEVLLRIWRTDQ